MSKVFEISGGVFIDTADCCATGARCPSILSSKQTVGLALDIPERTLNDALTWVDLLTANGFAKVTGLEMQVLSGTIQLRVSSALADDQVVPMSDVLVWASKVVGQELTTLEVRGVGTFSMMIAGSSS